jgi:MinD-like ATPase involved in chromosome partitioning or flagellar assembly
MMLKDTEPNTGYDPMSQVIMTDELITVLRQRVASQYYDQPKVIEMIARALLHSRGLYP